MLIFFQNQALIYEHILSSNEKIFIETAGIVILKPIVNVPRHLKPVPNNFLFFRQFF